MSPVNVDRAKAGLGLTILLGLALGRGWGSGEKPTVAGQTVVRLAYFPNLTHAPALVGMGRYPTAMPNVRVDPKVVNAGPEAMEALMAGEVDLAFVGPSPAINTFLRTKGQGLHIVAGACDGGASLVARDPAITDVRSLDGKTVAVPQIGGTQDVSLRHFLQANGLRPKERGGTVAVVPMANADILTQFKRGSLDAAWVPEPWATRLKAEGKGRIAVDERTLWPENRFTTTVLVVRQAFEKAHPDVVREFVRAHSATVQWIGEHPEEAQTAANAELKRLAKPLKPEILREAWSRVAFTTDPNPPNLEAFAMAAHDAGYLKGDKPNLQGLVERIP